MKGIVLLTFVVIFACAAESASTRKHKSRNVKGLEIPGAGDWPSPPAIGDFNVPEVFRGDSDDGDSEERSTAHKFEHRSQFE